MAGDGRIAAPVPPLTLVHQQLLLAQVAELRALGHDVGVLEQLAERLPELRRGLPAAERQRLEALDRNEHEVQAAYAALGELLQRVSGHELKSAVLLDAEMLRESAESSRQLAEYASEVSLRLRARLKLLIGEAA